MLTLDSNHWSLSMFMVCQIIVHILLYFGYLLKLHLFSDLCMQAKKKLLDYEHSLGKHVSDAEQLKQDLALLADERSALSSSLQSEQEKCRSLEHDFFNV